MSPEEGQQGGWGLKHMIYEERPRESDLFFFWRRLSKDLIA